MTRVGFNGNGKTWFKHIIIIEAKTDGVGGRTMTVYESRLKGIYFDTRKL